MRYVSSCDNSGSAAAAAAAAAAAVMVIVAAAAVLVMVVAVAAGALRLVVAGAMRGDARRLSQRSRCCCCGGGGGTAVVVVGHLPYLAGAQRTFLIWQVLCASLIEAVGAQAQLTAQCTGHVRDTSKLSEHVPNLYQNIYQTRYTPGHRVSIHDTDP